MPQALPISVVLECFDLGFMGNWWRAYQGDKTWVALFPQASDAQAVKASLEKNLDSDLEALAMQDLMTVH